MSRIQKNYTNFDCISIYGFFPHAIEILTIMIFFGIKCTQSVPQTTLGLAWLGLLRLVGHLKRVLCP